MKRTLSILRNTLPWLAIPIIGVIGRNMTAADVNVQDMQKRDLSTGNPAIFKAYRMPDGSLEMYVKATLITATPSPTNTPTPSASSTATVTPTPTSP